MEQLHPRISMHRKLLMSIDDGRAECVVVSKDFLAIG